MVLKRPSKLAAQLNLECGSAATAFATQSRLSAATFVCTLVCSPLSFDQPISYAKAVAALPHSKLQLLIRQVEQLIQIFEIAAGKAGLEPADALS